MSKETTIWIVIAVYVLFMLAVGILNSKNSKGMAAFTVGGRNAGAWISALSYGTAYFSAVMFIGYSGSSGWSYGLSVGPGGSWQRGVRFPAGLAGAGKTDPGMYQKIENQIDAPAVRNAV